jgi:parallel beta-helix repeat protein
MKSTLQLTFLASMSIATSASAVDRFVSLTGSDTAAGTITAPWKTIQKAANTAKAGDNVFIRAGTYKERVQINVSGTSTAPITFSNYLSEVVVLDETGVTPGDDLSAIIRIPGRNYVTIKGFELRNFRTTLDTKVPVGILVDGACTGVKLLSNKIHHIEQNNTEDGNFDANAHGIGVYGTSATPISGLVIDGNELSYLRLGASEALALNGNVTNFTVSNNYIHHANNIAIDVIGFEGTNSNKALDRARNGTIICNTITAIDSSTNPAYGGNFSSGGGALAVAGIYVDGGTQVVIERNHIFGCNYGIELASEAANGKTDFITVRNNVIRHNHLAGITLGGYDELRGATENCTILNNTIYENDTTKGYTGQILFQFFARKNSFKNNIIWANSSTKQVIVHYPGSDSASDAQKEFSKDNVFAYNLYYANGGTSSNLSFEAFSAGDFRSYSLSTWQKSGLSGSDTGSNVVNPKFATATPTTGATVSSFKLATGSPAINTGVPSFVTALSEMDVIGATRLNGGRIDRGASEY